MVRVGTTWRTVNRMLEVSVASLISPSVYVLLIRKSRWLGGVYSVVFFLQCDICPRGG